MNIATPYAATMAYPTANVNTESARRDNLLRETIPESSDAEQSAAEQGLGSESDQLKRNGLQLNSLTYEKIQTALNNATNNASQASGESIDQDNANDESAGKEDAEEKQRQQAESAEVEELKERDAEVRTHEQAHAATGGQYASAPSYEFETGPDGRRYAVDGEVSIDLSKEQTPEQTISKMQQVRAAALAPAEPSTQDLKVASEATKIAFEASVELAEQKREEAAVSQQTEEDTTAGNVPTLDEIIENNNYQTVSRTLDEAQSESNQDTATSTRTLEIDEALMNKRNANIQMFYQQAVEAKPLHFSASA